MALLSKQAKSYYITKFVIEPTRTISQGESVQYYWNGRAWSKSLIKYYTSLGEATDDCAIVGGYVVDVL